MASKTQRKFVPGLYAVFVSRSRADSTTPSVHLIAVDKLSYDTAPPVVDKWVTIPGSDGKAFFTPTTPGTAPLPPSPPK